MEINASTPRNMETAGPSVRLLYWIGLTVVTLGLAGIAIFLESDRLAPEVPLDRLFSYRLTMYANLTLVGAFLAYLAHLRFRAGAVGKWASGLATAGAVGLTASLLVRWFESYRVIQEGHAPLSNLYEVMVLFTAVTVIVYLAMESVYRNRSMGAFVLSIVLAAQAFEVWLVSQGQANHADLVPALKSYWMHAHVLANFIGYGAFAVAAAAGTMYLLRAAGQRRGMPRSDFIEALPDQEWLGGLMTQAVAIGFPVFTLATILGAVWAYEAWGGYWSWDPKETWALIVWLTYAAFLHLKYVKSWSGERLAWWAIVGFGVTLFCFLGVNLFLSGLHSYGQIG